MSDTILSATNRVAQRFPITKQDSDFVTEKFGKLIHFIAWKVAKCNDGELHDDLNQELWIAAIHAISYYKRQSFVESSFNALESFLEATEQDMASITFQDKEALKRTLDALKDKWANRTKHGGCQTRFGIEEEKELYKLNEKFSINTDEFGIVHNDGRFGTYLKSILWNASRQFGMKISRENKMGFVQLCEVYEEF